MLIAGDDQSIPYGAQPEDVPIHGIGLDEFNTNLMLLRPLLSPQIEDTVKQVMLVYHCHGINFDTFTPESART